jgi:hypothetical protein
MDATWRLATLALVMALIALGIYAFQERQHETKAAIVDNRHRLKQRAAKPPPTQIESHTNAVGASRGNSPAQETEISPSPSETSLTMDRVPLYTPIEIVNAFADNEISANRRFAGVFKVKGYVGPIRFEGGVADVVLYGGGVFDLGTVHCLAEGSDADSFESVHRNQVIIVFAKRAIAMNGMVVGSNCHLDSLSSAVRTDSGDWVRSHGFTPIEPLGHSR